MKKVISIVATCIVVCTAFIVACNKQSDNEIQKTITVDRGTPLAYVIGGDDYRQGAMVVRHAHANGKPDCTCPNCKCSGCKCPLGVCLCGGIIIMDDGEPLTQQQIDWDYGTAWMHEQNGKLHMIFHQPTALDDGSNIVPITGGPYTIPEADAIALGFSGEVTLENGEYTVDFTTYTYGEVYLDVVE